MKTINLNTGENIQLTMFPDNQPHVTVKDVNEEDDIRVICSITHANKMLQLLETANALNHLFANKKELWVPYLMGARSDRIMVKGDSIDLEVIAALINSCAFEKVFLFDVHSEVSKVLIHNSIDITNRQLVQAYDKKDAILICPDAGASKKIHQYFEWNNSFSEIIYCNKRREPETGKITLEVLHPENCNNKNCVIIDDICDGGGTFLAIAEKIKPAHLTLIVTHGIFSKGFRLLEKYFDQIIVSDSYCKTYDSNIVKTISLFNQTNNNV